MSSCPNCGFPLGPHPFDPSNPPSQGEQPSTKRVLGKDDTFFFGKYNGEKVNEILETNPAYIIWCAEHIEWLTVEPQLQKLAWDAKQNLDEFESYQDDSWFEYDIWSKD